MLAVGLLYKVVLATKLQVLAIWLVTVTVYVPIGKFEITSPWFRIRTTATLCFWAKVSKPDAKAGGRRLGPVPQDDVFYKHSKHP